MPGAELLEDRVRALAVVREVRDLWAGWLDGDTCKPTRRSFRQVAGPQPARQLENPDPRAAARHLSPAAFRPVLAECKAIHQRVLKGRVWVALHMHAGDGNVHTNIPVNSDDYEMLQTAHEAVGRIMVLARSLDGVISGEHGIGITKLEYLTDEELAPFAGYKAKVDPQGRFNKGKLLRESSPLFQQADQRQRRPEHGLHPQLRAHGVRVAHHAAERHRRHCRLVKDCLRCGKCKPVCATHVPRANLLYSPRNKILATSLLVEAFLYEEQTRRGISIKHWEEFEDVADHCTVCHKCYNPCPVKIDFGDVSMNMRNLLRKMGQKSFRPGNAAAMFFLNATNPETIKLMRRAPWSAWGSRPSAWPTCSKVWPASRPARRRPRWARRPIKEQVIHFINKKMPGGLPKKTARALLDIETRTTFPSSATRRPPRPTPRRCSISPGAAPSGCSARSGLATQAMLWHAGVQTVLPPGYLCCGYPQRGSGQFDKADKIITDNRVLFHRVANTLNYLDIKTVVVSCGTCYDQLQGYEFDKIFPGCRIIDIHEYLLEKGITLAAKGAYLYHDPCHSPMKLQDPMKTVKALVGDTVVEADAAAASPARWA
jgi:Fe-S oxidoreductase